LHTLFGEWSMKIKDWNIVRWKLMWWLHSGKVVEELLRKGEIEVGEKLTNTKVKPLSYDEFLEYMREWKRKFVIKAKEDSRSWKEILRCRPMALKTLFPEDRTEEMIAKVQVKAEKEILDWFGGKMVKELDEGMFEKYLKEGWEWNRLGLDDNEKRRAYFERFRNWTLNLEFGKFWNNFKRNVIKENWLEVKVWWKYIYKDGNYILSDKVNTLYPNK